jgi:hypothetical protein
MLPGTVIADAAPTVEPTILNHRSLSFVIDQTTRLLGPGERPIALHRIVGMDKSLAMSQLSQDNRLVLINPHRVLFDRLGFVDTGEYLATTLNLRGNHEAKAALAAGTVHISDHGYVALTTPGVTTEGVIVAGVSTTASDPQQKILLDFMSDGLIRYAVGQNELGQLTGVDGAMVAKASSEAESNRAGPGQMLINTRSAADIQRSVVNNGNVPRARRLVVQNGTIRLEGEKPMEAGVRVPTRPLEHEHGNSLARIHETGKQTLRSGTLSTAMDRARPSAPRHDVPRVADSRRGRLDVSSLPHHRGLDQASVLESNANSTSRESVVQKTRRAEKKSALHAKKKTHQSGAQTRSQKPTPPPSISAEGVLPEWMKYLPEITGGTDGPGSP